MIDMIELVFIIISVLGYSMVLHTMKEMGGTQVLVYRDLFDKCYLCAGGNLCDHCDGCAKLRNLTKGGAASGPPLLQPTKLGNATFNNENGLVQFPLLESFRRWRGMVKVNASSTVGGSLESLEGRESGCTNIFRVLETGPMVTGKKYRFNGIFGADCRHNLLNSQTLVPITTVSDSRIASVGCLNLSLDVYACPSGEGLEYSHVGVLSVKHIGFWGQY